MSFIEPAAPERMLQVGRQSGFWTPEKFEIAKTLWAAGNSAREIGNVIGCSRNCVIGKLHRASIYRIGPRVNGTRSYTPRKHVKKTDRKIRKWELGALATNLPPDQPDKPTELQQLGPHSCRWPCQGEGYQTLFCGGDVVDGYSYCTRHCRMAYVPDRPARKSSVVYFNSNGAKAA